MMNHHRSWQRRTCAMCFLPSISSPAFAAHSANMARTCAQCPATYPSCVHARIYASMHIRRHAHTQACICASTHIRQHARTPVHARTHIRAHMHAYIHAHIRARTHTHMRTHMLACTCGCGGLGDCSIHCRGSCHRATSLSIETTVAGCWGGGSMSGRLGILVTNKEQIVAKYSNHKAPRTERMHGTHARTKAHTIPNMRARTHAFVRSGGWARGSCGWRSRHCCL